jgi:hypothetical protein
MLKIEPVKKSFTREAGNYLSRKMIFDILNKRLTEIFMKGMMSNK